MRKCSKCNTIKTCKWQGKLCNKCYNAEYHIKNRERILEKARRIRNGEYEFQERILCIECLSDYTIMQKGTSSQIWHRIFEENIMIGWQCSLCYNDYKAKMKRIDRKILQGIKGLGKWEPKRRYYSARNRGNVKYSCMYHYSNGTMKCETCGTPDNLSIDHINDDGLEERKRLGNSGGYHFYLYLYHNGYPDGYRVLCRSCNSKDYASKQHLIVPRRYISKFKNNPQKITEYKNQLLEFFNILKVS